MESIADQRQVVQEVKHFIHVVQLADHLVSPFEPQLGTYGLKFNIFLLDHFNRFDYFGSLLKEPCFGR